jgi:hypothetical protein
MERFLKQYQPIVGVMSGPDRVLFREGITID